MTLRGTPVPPISPPSVTTGENGNYPRKRWTVEECRFLQNNGLLGDGRYELIEGDIVFKMPQGFAHKTSVTLLIAALANVFGALHLRNQADFGVGLRDPNNEPEPDVTVLQGTARDYGRREPLPEEVLLVCEVGASSLAGDLSVKAGIYARQNLREYWVLDVDGRELHVFRAPQNGAYISHDTLAEGDTIFPLAAPNAAINIADLLP
ncbi:MAG: Uma2 family endonuclease [Akkermansiaceae bacterium]|nr:Uma2 family endonuclease [Armatimonadota bacterium]